MTQIALCYKTKKILSLRSSQTSAVTNFDTCTRSISCRKKTTTAICQQVFMAITIQTDKF